MISLSSIFFFFFQFDPFSCKSLLEVAAKMIKERGEEEEGREELLWVILATQRRNSMGLRRKKKKKEGRSPPPPPVKGEIMKSMGDEKGDLPPTSTFGIVVRKSLEGKD